MGMILAVTAGPAAADPVRQPFTDENCRGFVVSHFASAEPDGVGNTLGGARVQSFQDVVRGLCVYDGPDVDPRSQGV